MSKHIPVLLTGEQQAHLHGLTTSGNAPARTQTRARILLLCNRNQEQPLADAAIATALHCNQNTVLNVRRRFVQGGLEAALYDKARPGAKPKLTGEAEAHLTLLACSAPPEGKSRWTLQLLAERMVVLGHVESLSDTTVGERLKKTHSSPGR